MSLEYDAPLLLGVMGAHFSGTQRTFDLDSVKFLSFNDIGDEGNRTPDLDSAIVALSQLSYVPENEAREHT